MRFHTFGNAENKIIVLIHGVLTPWQIWESQIEYFKENYFVIVPALDAHVEENASEYLSVEEEAKEIENYICTNYGNQVFALCGLSMGGYIANRIFERGKLDIENLVLDGAPLVKIPSLFTNIMINQYKTIIHKSKQRVKKVLESFKKNFLPEKFLQSYLKFADTMSDSSIQNMIYSVCNGKINANTNSKRTKILFLHGTKGNEIYSKKAAKQMKAYYPDLEIRCFKGYMHAQLAIYEADKWSRVVDSFLQS